MFGLNMVFSGKAILYDIGTSILLLDPILKI